MAFLPVAIAQLAKTAAPLDPTPTWTTLKGLLNVRTDRGRARSLDTFSAGRADGTFDNRDRSYDPTYTAGPYGANLVPDKQIRILAGLNLLTEQQSSLEDVVAGLGWSAVSNCSVARSITAHADGAASLRLRSSGAGDMTAATPSGTNGIPVFSGVTYTAFASMQAAATGRTVRVEIFFYDSAGTFVSSVLGDTVVAPITDPVGSFTTAPPSVVGTAPGDGFAAMRVTVLGAAGANEDHYADKLAFCAGEDPDLPWSRGTGLEPIFTGLVESWSVNRADEMNATTQLVASDIFKLLSYKKLRKTTYRDAVLALSPDHYWRLDELVAGTNGLTANAFVDSAGATDLSADRQPISGVEGPLVTDPSTAASFSPTKGGAVFAPTCPLARSNAFSIAFWLKTSASPPANTSSFAYSVASWPWPLIFGCDDGAGQATFTVHIGDNFPVDQTASLWCFIHDQGGVNVQGIGTLPGTLINDGEWHHCVFTRSSDGLTLTWYIDGVAVRSLTAGPVCTIPASTSATYFGQYGPTSSEISQKDMAWWASRCLTAGEVLTLYKAGIFPSESVGARLGRCLDAVGVDVSKRSLDAGITLRPYKKPLHGAAALSHMAPVVEHDGGALFTDANGVVTFRARGHAAPAVAATIADDPGAGEIPVSPGPGPTIDDADLFDEVDITGDAIQPVVVNAGTDGTRNHQISDWQGANQSDANSLASALYTRYSTPTARVRSLRYEPQSLFTEAPAQALKIDLLARVTHRQKGVGHTGTASSMTQYVEHIAHDVTPGKLWSVEYALSPYA